MKFFSKFSIVAVPVLFYFLIQYNFMLVVGKNHDIPIITLESPIWEYIDSSNSSLLTGSNSQITLTCTAKYPIKWTILGHQGLHFFHAGERKMKIITDTEKYNTYNYNGKENNITVENVEYSVQTWNFFESDTIASVKAICQSMNGNPTLKSSVDVFVYDKMSTLICPPKANILPENTIIPCSSTDPRLKVKLFKQNPKTIEFITVDGEYDPVLGFTIKNQNELSGTFVCSTANDNCTILVGDERNAEGFFFTPTERQVTQWSNKNLTLTCKGTNGNVEFVTESGNIVARTKNQLVLEGKNGETGTVRCEYGKISHTWNYLFVDAPRLAFNHATGETDCVSPAGDKSIASVRCENKNDCDLYRGCFDDKNCQNKSRQVYFTGEPVQGFCPSANFSSCISIRDLFFNGMIECAVANKQKSILFEFFTSLSLIKYQRWQDAPENELLRMDSFPAVLYTNEPQLFVCEASSYLFASGFIYEIVFANNTMRTLRTDELKVNRMIATRRQVAELNIVSAVKIMLPTDAIGINCFGSLLDASTVLRASAKFSVKSKEAPVIRTDNQIVVFENGSERQRLICSTKGEPFPIINWERKDKPLEAGFITRTTTDGDGILEFPVISKQHAGEYFCIAKNVVGNDTMKFIVSVRE